MEELTTGQLLSFATSIVAIVGVIITWRKTGADIIHTLQETVSDLSVNQADLLKSLNLLKAELANVTEERDQWRKLAEQYRLGLEKAERRIEEIKEEIKKRSGELFLSQVICPDEDKDNK